MQSLREDAHRKVLEDQSRSIVFGAKHGMTVNKKEKATKNGRSPAARSCPRTLKINGRAQA